jgi:hypothetical protein
MRLKWASGTYALCHILARKAMHVHRIWLIWKIDGLGAEFHRSLMEKQMPGDPDERQDARHLYV